MGLGAKPRRWAPLTRDTLLSEYNEDLIFFDLMKTSSSNYSSLQFIVTSVSEFFGRILKANLN